MSLRPRTELENDFGFAGDAVLGARRGTRRPWEAWGLALGSFLCTCCLPKKGSKIHSPPQDAIHTLEPKSGALCQLWVRQEGPLGKLRPLQEGRDETNHQ